MVTSEGPTFHLVTGAKPKKKNVLWIVCLLQGKSHREVIPKGTREALASKEKMRCL